MKDRVFLSLNAWGGAVPGFHSFLRSAAYRTSYIALQEVNHAVKVTVDYTHRPKLPGARTLPLRAHLKDEIERAYKDKFLVTFAAHLKGCHDTEPDERLEFGLSSLVRNSHFTVLATVTDFVYGEPYTHNNEAEGGTPSSKVAIGQLLMCRESGRRLILVNVHGFWSQYGKVDMPARFEQNQGINRLIEVLQRKDETGSAGVILLGDLNYTSEMQALYDLAGKPGFGNGGGVILNHRFSITDTRTSYYKKPVREADFAIVSRDLADRVVQFTAIRDNVPSDHALLSLRLNLTTSVRR